MTNILDNWFTLSLEEQLKAGFLTPDELKQLNHDAPCECPLHTTDEAVERHTIRYPIQG